ncbi:hypothetical protein C882_1444 [Caenispirillum salinarum AK4]|uniref:Sirohydrochlorin cobaltochelatase n=1 Tax=Caenispirillum salinarum AK4 TaxID=1238182 RepID=K9HAK0_9PROT|nr:CbiX/SirB N-terminal domain-containing protein [Caenispirillum salinarum]EKV27598.1 hypothetical protein C882_1444 [Caenispirillum salinarum AK4]
MSIIRPSPPRAADERPILVIVGHGSPRDAAAGLATVATALTVARGGRYRAVPALMKGEPALPRVLQSLPPGSRAYVLPHFGGAGVFATRHIPEVVAESSSHLAEARVLPALGESPRIIERTNALLREVGRQADAPADLLVVGHGSSAGGDAAAEALAFGLGGADHCGAAHAVFLERAPLLTDALNRLPLGREVLVSVLLAARGRHACLDVPDALGLPRNSALSGPDGEALGPVVMGDRRLWLHAPLTDARLMADAATAAADAALVENGPAPVSHPATRALDHNQGGLAATA